MRTCKWRAARMGMKMLIGTYLASICQAGSLVDLAPKADLIVLGTAQGRNDSGHVISFSLSVEKAFKGTVGPGSVLSLQWQSWAPGDQKFGSESWRGIWFLRQANGNFEIMPVRVGAQAFFHELFYQVATQPAAPELRSTAETPVLDSIIIWLANAAAYDGNDQILEAAAGMQSENITKVFRFLGGLSGPRQRAIGLAGLIARNDVPSLQQLEGALSVLSTRDIEPVATAIRIWFRNPDDKAVAALGRLVRTGPEVVRDAASVCLSRIHTRAAVPFLASLLDDQSAARRASGVSGLAAFANGIGIETPANTASMAYMRTANASPYRTADTAKYAAARSDAEIEQAVAFWKSWWQKYQNEFRN